MPESTPISRANELIIRRTRVVTPSKISSWFGRWADDEAVFTAEQLAALAKRGLDPATVERIDVKLKVTEGELWWPIGAVPHRVITCPVIGKRNARVKVISPIGDIKLVWPSGWTKEK